jgi:hypothetical protein
MTGHWNIFFKFLLRIILSIFFFFTPSYAFGLTLQWDANGEINLDGVGHVHTHINFEKYRWWTRISGVEASGLMESDGASVGLSIGSNVGEDSFDWTRKYIGSRRSFAKFVERPRMSCRPENDTDD